MNQKLSQVYTTLLSLFVVVIPSIDCHQNSKISVCPGEGNCQSRTVELGNKELFGRPKIVP